MSEIRLTKPLYKDSGPPSGTGSSPAPEPVAAAPRPPKPPLWMRGAALAVDLLLLHGVALLVLKLAFEPIVALGAFGPFIGLAFATLYLTIGSSLLTEGRTIGKLVMRLQTADARAGLDLPVGRALLRAMLMTWPLWVYAAVALQVELMANPENLDASPIILQMAGFAIAAAWYLGNLFHALYDPYGRSWIDRIAGSIVVSTEAPAENLQEFLRTVREVPNPPAARRAQTALIAATLTVLALDLALSWFWVKQFRELPETDRAKARVQRQTFTVTGFPLPMDMALEQGDAAQSDQQTTAPQGVQFQYRRRGTLTAEQVKANPSALTAIDRVTSAVADTIRSNVPNMTEAQAEKIAKAPPEKAKIQVSFAELGDLFFASQAANVYSESRMLDLEALRQEALATTGTAAMTTGTVTTIPPEEPPTTGSATQP